MKIRRRKIARNWIDESLWYYYYDYYYYYYRLNIWRIHDIKINNEFFFDILLIIYKADEIKIGDKFASFNFAFKRAKSIWLYWFLHLNYLWCLTDDELNETETSNICTYQKLNHQFKSSLVMCKCKCKCKRKPLMDVRTIEQSFRCQFARSCEFIVPTINSYSESPEEILRLIRMKKSLVRIVFDTTKKQMIGATHMKKDFHIANIIIICTGILTNHRSIYSLVYWEILRVFENKEKHAFCMLFQSDTRGIYVARYQTNIVLCLEEGNMFLQWNIPEFTHFTIFA